MAERVSSAPSQPTKAFTAAERIAELNEIDKSVSVLLSSASDAIGILSNSAEANIHKPKTLARAKEQFTEAATTYFSTLSSIEVRLRRQVYALDEAGLVEQGDKRDEKAGAAIGGDNASRTGGGPLDPSWLNARADNKVETQMRREILKEARAFLNKGNVTEDAEAMKLDASSP